nr:thrombopoietin receptor [Pogona vitticeps]
MYSSPNRMVIRPCSVRPFPLLVLFVLLPTFSFVLISDEEAAVLAKTEQENLFCFSRTFEDLTCFWDEPIHVKGSYHFFYTYEGDVKRECNLTTGKSTDGRWRHVCIFPNDHHSIQVFSELFIEVLDTITNHTTLSQKLSVENVGLIAPPVNVSVEWPGLARQLCVTWVPPPIYHVDVLIYEVLYGVEASTEPPSRIEVKNSHTCLHDLLPGQWYRIQIRTKPDGISLNGFWGPWSPAVLAEMPHLPGEINLHCFTPDLRQLHCQWEWMTMEPDTYSSCLYWAEYNSISTRPHVWHKCEEKEERSRPDYNSYSYVCTFCPKNTSYISVLVTVTQGQQKQNYFEEPFQLHHMVLTAPPKILQATVDRGILKMEWNPPLEELAEHMVYQIQYGAKDTLKWKALQVQYSNNSEIHLATGDHYCLQLRTQPDGQKFRGHWSAWSECVCVEIPPDTDSTIMNMAIALLLCAVLVLGLSCTCLSTFSSVKQKLWPPIPDLHHILDAFLEDNSKQHQQEQENVNALFCDKSLEDTPLTCLLEVLPEMPQETPIYESLLDTIPLEQAEWDSEPSSHQHYMVLSPNDPQGSHNGNEYFDSTGNGCDTLPLPLEHDQHITPEHKRRLSSFTLFDPPHLGPELKEERKWEDSANQSTSATHISNQSYLLMG